MAVCGTYASLADTLSFMLSGRVGKLSYCYYVFPIREAITETGFLLVSLGTYKRQR